jgi:uncharacterized LabA/DUF88 family protein
MGISSPYSGPKEVRYLFVDAGCLRATIDKARQKYLGSNGVCKIAWSALRSGHDKVFYYDAVPSRGYDESDTAWEQRINPRMQELREIRQQDGYHVPLGDLRGKTVRQKKVDVMIAVDMLLHTIRRNMHACTLLAGDSDFQPLLDALVREGMSVTLWHPDHAPDDLVGAADASKLLYASQLLRLILGPSGKPLLPHRSEGIRPSPFTKADFEWTYQNDGTFYKASICQHGEGWLAERYDPAASATSVQLSSEDPHILVNAVADLWDVQVADEDFQRARKLSKLFDG